MSNHYQFMLDVLQERARFFSTYGAGMQSYLWGWGSITELSFVLMNEPLRVHRFMQKYIPKIRDGKVQKKVTDYCHTILEGIRDLESLAEDYRVFCIQKKIEK
ncbi:MAG: hypothetical protein Q7R96_03755 [Nanoarchaeota archaeon]|nr:hypothetical protein [Nanoarchaeota archaeon]